MRLGEFENVSANVINFYGLPPNAMEDLLLLELKKINAGYGFLHILRDISLHIEKGEYICLLGPNGAGKSTILKTIAGIIQPEKGDVVFHGQSLLGLPVHKRCRMGLSFVSEELNLFKQMTVKRNLSMGAYSQSDRTKKQRSLDFVFELFPRLKEREKQLAGTLSGGERKMLAIARGIMSAPSLLLVDEPSLGLAPIMTNTVFQALDALRNDGLTIILVEQNVTKSLQVTERGYVIENGKLVLEGKSSDLAKNNHVRAAYLGVR